MIYGTPAYKGKGKDRSTFTTCTVSWVAVAVSANMCTWVGTTL